MNLVIEQKRKKLLAKLEELKRVESVESLEKKVAFTCIERIFLRLIYYYNKPYMKDYRDSIRKIVKLIQREFDVIDDPDFKELMSSNFNKFTVEIMKNNDIKNIVNETTEDNINE